MQRDLDGDGAAPAEQARRQHLGVVDHQQIARRQQARQVGDAMIREAVGSTTSSRAASRGRRRMLGDTLGRQVKIELVDPHGSTTEAGKRGRLDAGPCGARKIQP